MSHSKPQTIYLKDYAKPDYSILETRLHFELGQDYTFVRASLKMHRDKGGPDLHLHGEHLELQSLKLDGKEWVYEADQHGLTVSKVPDDFILETTVKIKPQDNKSLMGLFKTRNTFCTQCEAEGFRKITYYLDRPDAMSLFTTTITADKKKYPVLLSNGNLIADQTSGNQRTVTWQDPFKKPSYLFALVAGNLDHLEDYFTTQSGRKVTLRIYVEPGKAGQCHHAMDAIKKSMRWDEVNYGREYDLDIFMIVAVSDFNMGAMENKGLNIFNDKYILANPASATDADYKGIDIVVAHEYFHNWSGNRVTCRDWFQLSLKEGFTVFRDQSFSEDVTSVGVSRIEQANIIRNHQFIEDASPLSHPVRPESFVEINNFYTVTIYNKGAEVIRMLKTILGSELYRKGTDLYFERHDGQAVTTDEFVQAMADVSKKDLSVFKRWYSQAGTPMVKITDHYDAATKKYFLTMHQETRGNPQHIPVNLGLLDASGPEILNTVVHLTEQEQTFTFENIATKPVPSLFRHFSAPVKFDYAYTNDDLYFLLNHDTDDFNRWAAVQQVATNVIKKRVGLLQESCPLTACKKLGPAFKELLEKPIKDRLLLSQLLVLPSEMYLSEQFDVIDVDAIHQAREFVRHSIVEEFGATFLKAYEDNAHHVVAGYNAEAVGHRALKNVCLSYLVLIGRTDLALSQVKISLKTNMTDTIAALGALAQTDSPERVEALKLFYEEWKHNPLVMDKWFTIQALSIRSAVLDDVKCLMKDPIYDAHNPNRVRALIGTFTSNAVHFHNKNGSGYELLLNIILELEPKNPQLATRLVQPLAQWRRYDAHRQSLMKAALKKVLDQASSNDMLETVGKLLG